MERLRAGRLSNDERALILDELGKITQKRFNKNLINNSCQYNLSFLRDTLYYEMNINDFENMYYIDTGDEEGNKLATYFEYGTGIYNIKQRRGPIKSKRKGGKLKFRKMYNGRRFATSVKGVKPVFMMTKAIKSVENERQSLQRQIRFRLKI